jgi:hypothetical protein
VKWKLTLPSRDECRQLLAYVFGSHTPEPDPEPPANYRPYVPQHGGSRAPARRYTTAPTKTPLDKAVARKLLIGRVTLSIERRARPAAAAGLTPAAHTAPPADRLALEVPTLPTPPRIPHFDDLKAQFATGRRRGTAAHDLTSVAGLYPALPAPPARHALPGGAK